MNIEHNVTAHAIIQVLRNNKGFDLCWHDINLPDSLRIEAEIAKVIEESVGGYQEMAQSQFNTAAKLRAELEEFKQTFDLRWKADMRAIELWRKETGKELVWPDHVDLCAWLLERAEKAEKALAEMRAVVEQALDAINDERISAATATLESALAGTAGSTLIDPEAVKPLVEALNSLADQFRRFPSCYSHPSEASEAVCRIERDLHTALAKAKGLVR